MGLTPNTRLPALAPPHEGTSCSCLHVQIGGIAPLVFGQYGELSAGFEELIDALAVKGCDQAAERYLLDVGPGAASVQKRLLRQRVNCCVARAQAGVLLRRLKFALPGWAQAERSRKDWRDQAAQRAAQARAYSGSGASSSPGPTPNEVGGVAGVRVRAGLRAHF